MTVTPTATPAAAPSATGTARLPQLTSDLFAFALSLRSAKDPGNAQQLFDNIARLLEQLSQRARNAGVDSAHLDAARYAFCALLDEMALILLPLMSVAKALGASGVVDRSKLDGVLDERSHACLCPVALPVAPKNVRSAGAPRRFLPWKGEPQEPCVGGLEAVVRGGSRDGGACRRNETQIGCNGARRLVCFCLAGLSFCAFRWVGRSNPA